MAFAHLHVHTEFSLLDGACRIEPLILAAKKQGQTAIAVTDHGVMYGVVDFYRAAKKHGLHPVIGCEVYVAARSRQDKVHELDKVNHHLVLLCENNTGYQNLIKLVSLAWTEGFYGKPRVDHELLEKYHEGIIALSACLAGEIPRKLLQGDYAGAKETALWYAGIFGKEHYYLEIQDHGLKDQLVLNPLLYRLSEETGIPLVATNDVHYIEKADSRVQQVLICIQTNHVVGEDTGLEFGAQEFYLKNEAEMSGLFEEHPEAVLNTQIIADRCQVEFEFGNTKLPHFEVPGGEDHFTYFRRLCEEGLQKRYGEHPPREYKDRLGYELDVINRMGYTDYFLIVSDFISFARSQDIPVGPGRGSGAASIAAYCIGITGIDPMKYQLLFERFLNPERVSMPDFDIDFCYERRPEVIDYVVRKYGADHVAQIVTFGTLAARAAIRDVGRALGVPYGAVDGIAKLVPMELNMTIERAMKLSGELRKLYGENEQVKDLLDTALKVEGMPRHASTHAAGVVITRDPVNTYVPLAKNDESVVTQFTMTTLEELGLLKMDFLGLRTLTVIRECETMIRRRVPGFTVDAIPLEDAQVYRMVARGQTEGVFQFESAGMKQVLTSLKPEMFEDLIAVISLYRPGPMAQISTYIENRHHPERVTYKTPMLRDILDVTYGCMVYQEQVMQIFRSLAGYSYGRADIVRRAMSKKKHDVMEQERRHFIFGMEREDGTVECEGAVKRGIDQKTANSIFDEMTSFASYAFNKAHAAAYAYVAYQTAYLKCYYPCEYLAALLTSVLENTNKVAGYIAECQRLGIRLLPPDINESLSSFTVVNGNIRFGLLAIKNLGRGFIHQIIEERKNGKFHGLYDFCSRMVGKEFNKRAVESLIHCGALDHLDANRHQMILALPGIISDLEDVKRRNIDGQMGFFDAGPVEEPSTRFVYPKAEEYPKKELLSMEKEITGLYLSDHPLTEYEGRAESVGAVPIAHLHAAAKDPLSPYKDGSKVRMFGIISRMKLKNTRNDSTMAFVTFEDRTGDLEVLVFPKILMANTQLIREGNILLLDGKLNLREEEEAKVICESVFPVPSGNNPPDTPTRKQRRRGLFLRFKEPDSPEQKRAETILSIFEGTVPLYFYYEDKKKYIQQPASLFVDVNAPMLQELKRILGEENVVFTK